MRQNGVRGMAPRKPQAGEIWTDAVGNLYEIVNCGLRYANVKKNGEREIGMVNIRDIFPSTMHTVHTPAEEPVEPIPAKDTKPFNMAERDAEFAGDGNEKS